MNEHQLNADQLANGETAKCHVIDKIINWKNSMLLSNAPIFACACVKKKSWTTVPYPLYPHLLSPYWHELRRVV